MIKNYIKYKNHIIKKELFFEYISLYYYFFTIITYKGINIMTYDFNLKIKIIEKLNLILKQQGTLMKTTRPL